MKYVGNMFSPYNFSGMTVQIIKDNCKTDYWTRWSGYYQLIILAKQNII